MPMKNLMKKMKDFQTFESSAAVESISSVPGQK